MTASSSNFYSGRVDHLAQPVYASFVFRLVCKLVCLSTKVSSHLPFPLASFVEHLKKKKKGLLTVTNVYLCYLKLMFSIS